MGKSTTAWWGSPLRRGGEVHYAVVVKSTTNVYANAWMFRALVCYGRELMTQTEASNL